MLISELFFELNNHKKKLIIVFVVLAALGTVLMNFTKSQFIKQKLYININPLIEIKQTIDFFKLQNSFKTSPYFEYVYKENKFYSPKYRNKNLDLATPALYKSFLDEDTLSRITKKSRPGYNILVKYDESYARYEITLQLFNNMETFLTTTALIEDGIIDYFNRPKNTSDLKSYYSQSLAKFNDLKFLSEIYLSSLQENIEIFENQYSNINIFDPITLYSKLELIDKLTKNKIKFQIMNKAITELNLIEKKLIESTSIDSFYNITYSDYTYERRGLYPEYVIILFIILFSGFAFLTSYLSLLKKK